MGNEVEMGIKKPETQERFRRIVEKMAVEKPAPWAIIPDCTELPGFLSGVELPVPTIDTMELHIGKRIDLMLEGKRRA